MPSAAVTYRYAKLTPAMGRLSTANALLVLDWRHGLPVPAIVTAGLGLTVAGPAIMLATSRRRPSPA
jgi:hypothetical protein